MTIVTQRQLRTVTDMKHVSLLNCSAQYDGNVYIYAVLVRRARNYQVSQRRPRNPKHPSSLTSETSTSSDTSIPLPAHNSMDSFFTISFSGAPEKVSAEAEKSQIPVDEEYQSSNGFAYCVIA